MRIRCYAYIALITIIITACFMTGCEKIPTQVITTEPVEKVAVVVIYEAAYHDFFSSKGAPIDPDFFTNQYLQTFLTGNPEEFEQEMRTRLTDLYIASGINFENPADLVGYNQLLITFLDARTTAWMLGYFQGDDTAFGEWIVAVLRDVPVRAGGGARIGCGVIALIE